MLHTDGFVADRPVDVELLIGADGPKGTAVAERVGDGVFAAGVPNPAAAGRPYSLLQFGTVLDDGEDVHSARVMEQSGARSGRRLPRPVRTQRRRGRAAIYRAEANGWPRSRPFRPPSVTSSPTRATWCG